MKSMRFMPPLRLVLTDLCNGACQFCHNEGNNSCSCSMSSEMIDGCIQSAIDLQIPKIALTGGEPTLRRDLHVIINELQERTKASISLVTNGLLLATVGKEIKRPLDNLNLSISSFENSIAARYQRVNPEEALKSFLDFPALNKNLNIVITKDNYKEIDLFINWCIKEKVSLDLMFVSDDDYEYHEIEGIVMNKLLNMNVATIDLNLTPVMSILLSKNSILHIKHPYLSGFFHDSLCNSCDARNACFEKICAIRVHPDGKVSPCLSKRIISNGNNVYERIINIYKRVGTMTLRKEFFEYPLMK